MATQAISPNVTPNHIAAPTSTASIPACDTGVGRAARNPALSTQISMRSPTLTALPVLNQSVRAPTPTGQVARTEMLVMWGTCVGALFDHRRGDGVACLRLLGVEPSTRSIDGDARSRADRSRHER